MIRSIAQAQLASQQNPVGIRSGSSHTLFGQILLRKSVAPICRPCATDIRCRHTAACSAWSIVSSRSRDRFQSILPNSRSCKTFRKQTCRRTHITIVFAILTDNARIAPSGLPQRNVGTDFFENGCGIFSQISRNDRKAFLFSETNFNGDSIPKG